MERKKFYYYKSYWEISKELNQKQFFLFNKAIFSVMFFEKNIEEIDFKDKTLKVLWNSIKHSLETSLRGYHNRIQGDTDNLLRSTFEDPSKGPRSTFEDPSDNIQYTINNNTINNNAIMQYSNNAINNKEKEKEKEKEKKVEEKKEKEISSAKALLLHLSSILLNNGYIAREPKTTDARIKKIAARLKTYSEEELKSIFSLLEKPEYKYLKKESWFTIDFIIRNDENIEKIANNYWSWKMQERSKKDGFFNTEIDASDYPF